MHLQHRRRAQDCRSSQRRRRLFVEALESRRLLAFTVTNVNDSGAGSLRQAILDANATPAADLIQFNIGGSARTISPTSPLPEITAPVVLDATTQPGYAGKPLVELDGTNAGNGSSGLIISSGNSTVRGLAIGSFNQNGIWLRLGDHNVIESNYIGTDLTGTTARRNTFGVQLSTSDNRVGTDGNGVNDVAERNLISGNVRGVLIIGERNVVAGNFIGTSFSGSASVGNAFGVWVLWARDTRIGTDGNGVSDSDERNIISGNSEVGIQVIGEAGVATASTAIAGNYIGIAVDGVTALPNRGNAGILVTGTSTNTRIGTDGNGIGDTAERNVISGNSQEGIQIEGSATIGTVIAGNFVGVSADGMTDVGNGFAGIYVVAGSTNTRIGTNGDGAGDTAERNLISGNTNGGIVVQDATTTNTAIAGNWVGINILGSTAIPNSREGIGIYGATGTRIGTNGDGIGDAAERNIVAGNTSSGVLIVSGASTSSVSGNYIGVDPSGTVSIPNIEGVHIVDSFNTKIQSNLISGNTVDGVFLQGGAGTSVARNTIGTDVAGTVAIGNGNHGVRIERGAVRTIVGTDGDGVEDTTEGNLISGNNDGVSFWEGGASDTVIAGNRIGTNAAGTAAIANRRFGIWVNSGSTNTRIGTDGNGRSDAAERNVISGNVDIGILVESVGTDRTAIAGNYVGLDASGTLAVPNRGNAGIYVWASATNTRIGTDGNGVGDVAERNVISGNLQEGIQVDSVATTGTVIAGNYIGTNADGTAKVGNAFSGILVWGGAKSTRIGTDGNGTGDLAEQNVISGNGGDGVQIQQAGTDGTIIAGNLVGTDRTGTAKLGNGFSGVAVFNGPARTRIGTDGSNDLNNESERNLISGNVGDGVFVNSANTSDVVVAGNYIGLDSSGLAGLGNGINGVILLGGVKNTRIGTNGDGIADDVERNVVASNGNDGIQVRNVGTDRTVIAGNYIGTDKLGTGKFGNALSGVAIFDGPSNTRVGTDGSNDAFNTNERNIISGNGGSGISVTDSITTGTVIAGNWVGVNATGNVSVPNNGSGVNVLRAVGARIGTNADGVADATERNVVSGNLNSGIQVQGGVQEVFGLVQVDQMIAGTLSSRTSTGTLVQADLSDITSPSNGNWSFNRPVPGGGGDDYAFAATGTLQVNVAGTYSFAMAGNEGGRLRINGTTVITDDQLQSFSSAYTSVTLTAGAHTFEWTGFEQTGTAGWELSVALGAGKTSAVTAANGWKVLGDPTPHPEISLSGLINVTAYYSTQVIDTATAVAGNFIGTNVAGSSAIPNRGNAGITVGIAARNTRIGTNGDGVFDATERNVVSGNSEEGIQIEGSAKSTTVAGNYVGTDATGLLPLGNGSSGTYSGVLVWGNATENRIGGPLLGQGNLLAYNTASGLSMPDVVPANSSIVRNNLFRQNAIIGVDLGSANATPNDTGDIDGVRNAPVITTARIDGTFLVVEGYARPGTEFDLYDTATYANGFGQGNRFLSTLVEGSAQDLSGRTGSYGPTVNGVNVGNDTTNRFKFAIPLASLPSGIAIGTSVTAIAIGTSSEFSAIARVGVPDATLPTSAVQALPLNASSLSIPVAVVGTDPAGLEGPASGVMEYDLYVASASGPFTKFATVPANNPNATFDAISNNVYYFRSVARDNEGNEEIDTGADAFIRVGDFDKPISQVDDAIANSLGVFTIVASGSDSGRIARFDYYVVIDDALPPTLMGSSNATRGTGDNFSGSLVYQGIVDGQLHKYRFFSRALDAAGNVEDAATTGDKEVQMTFVPVPSLQPTGIDVQLGARQRSYLRYVDVLFGDASGVGSLIAQPNRVRVEKFALSDLSATDLTRTGEIVSAALAQTGAGNRLRLDFGIEGIGSKGASGARNTVAGDGFYRVRVDANNDGDFLDAGETFEFYRLLGDADGNGLVDAADTAVVDSYFGQIGLNLEGDLNGDGAVNSADKIVTQRSYRGRSLSTELRQLLDD